METIKGTEINTDDEGIEEIIGVLKSLDYPAGSFEITDELFGRHHKDKMWFLVLKWLELGIEREKIQWALDKRGWKIYRAKPGRRKK